MNTGKRSRLISRALKIALLIVAAYTVYALGASTLAHAFPKSVSETARQRFDSTDFYGGETAGPDRVLLAETARDGLNLRLELVRSAQESLDIVSHNILAGDSTAAFLGEVLLAAERGVQVRLLTDAKVGTEEEAGAILRLLDTHENISCRGFNPLNLLKPWAWHTVLHDKFILVDDTYLLLGGRNLDDRFFAPAGYEGRVADDREVLVWGDTSAQSVLPDAAAYMDLLWGSPLSDGRPGRLRATDPAPAALFERTAAFEAQNPDFFATDLEDYLAGMLPTGKVSLIYNPVAVGQKEPWVGYQLRALALDATRSVLIQTPYATANRLLLDALTLAGQDAEVVYLTNSMAGSPNIPAFSNYYYNRVRFVRTGAALYEYQSVHSIHGKAIVIDGRLSAIGSYNLDDRSLHLDTETMLIIDSEPLAAQLTAAMGEYMARSLLVGPDNRYVSSPQVRALPVPPMKQAFMFTGSVFSRMFQFLV